MSKWAIRDIEHGKTYFFDTWHDLEMWVSDMVYEMFPSPGCGGIQ